ncbi:glycoside hydrolase family 9 protein [Paenibacillus sp. MMS20-IR301]|uniref:glycoside hydrolase family 9 protein n=1 Tax=Paenibacillus sp. MMS20-IR301 TaxID=2895946 RepID=UPI0028E3CAEB|nr:glycoside hydrolase family 9 protein [Paenibacillus sp. MMS20-IR301]WNS45243.1 glycoside hydrolase family 9 protein [Paenibacillus sp. MMS20-IR301]
MRKKVSLFLAVTLFATILFSVPAKTEAAVSEAPAGWRDLVDYRIFSTISDGWAGDSGFGLETVDSKLPIDNAAVYNGLPSLLLNTKTPSSPSWYNALITVAGWKAYDFTSYYPNGYLEFNIKGNAGGETFLLGFKDRVFERAAGNEITTTVNINSYTSITTAWKHVKIPLKDLMQVSQGINISSIDALSLKNNGFQPLKVWLNDIRVTSPDKEKEYAPIKVNQLGYPADGVKQALVTGFEDVLTADAGTPFKVINTATNTAAFTGALVLTSNYDAIDSGERIFTADFTGLTAPGQYYVAVQGLQNSPKFTIGDAGSLYEPFLNDVTRYFYYQRTGINITSPYTQNYQRTDFTPDTSVPLMSNPSIRKDVSKGWYDAGDKGKYVNAGAKALSDLFWAYELMPEKFTDSQFNIPESGNGIPDILDESRWELEWMLKMQDEATGGFYARVTFQDDDNMVDRQIIDKDTVSSRTGIKTTADTATAAGVLAHAYLIYQNIDPAFAQSCLDAAEAAWGYLEAHPENIRTPNTGRWPYDVTDDASNRLWAAGSLYRSTGAAEYNNYFLAHYADMAIFFEDALDFASGWANTWNTGFFSYLKAAAPDSAVVSWYTDKFQQWFNDKVSRYNDSAWKSVIKDGNYYWGITMQVADTPMEMIIGTKLLGTFESNRAVIDEVTYSQLDWILGQNPVGVSFVSGYGDNSVKYPFSIMFRTDNLPGVPKGYLVGGPNRYSNDITVGNQISRFAGKNYTDNFQEWTTNEHTVYWNSGLVFVAAYATGTSTTSNSSISPVTAAFDKKPANQSDIPVNLTLNGNTLTGIRNGTASLIEGTDYTVSNNTVTLLKGYLAGQQTGTVHLTFEFSAGASAQLSVIVTDSSVANSAISPVTASFDKKTASQADIPVALTLNGNTLTGIKNGSVSLVQGTDYTISGAAVTLQKAYLAAQPVGTTTLTFNFSAGASAALTVTVVNTTSGGTGSIKVQQYNSTATGNTLSPRIKLVNTGTSAINLADVKLHYYYSIDGEKDQSYWCDWSTVGSANVTGTFIKPAAPVSGADTLFELGFTSGAGSLAAGASIEIQIRISKNDWSNYSQADDYSFVPAGTSYADWSKTTAYIAGTLQWGIEP